MNKYLKAIIGKVIDMKCFEVQELNFEDMTEEEKAEHDNTFNKTAELQGKLKKMLTEEQWEVLEEYSDAENSLNASEQRYMFNRGVKMGLNELSFIKEELGQGVICL